MGQGCGEAQGEKRGAEKFGGGGKVFLGVKTKNKEGVLEKPEGLLVCSKLFEKRDRAILCMGERENVYIISREGT